MFHEKFGFMLIFWNMAGVYVSDLDVPYPKRRPRY
jgi:hypothetical protein